jgi:hypothetical protein
MSFRLRAPTAAVTSGSLPSDCCTSAKPSLAILFGTTLTFLKVGVERDRAGNRRLFMDQC